MFKISIMKKVITAQIPKGKFKVNEFIEKSIGLKKNQYKDVSFHIKCNLDEIEIAYEDISAPFPPDAFITN